ncbi:MULTISPECIES: hypothetical protein [unclassified Mesorhizobium]|uniref:hypothetical protein n=1 Tax=unclassified Mesorhizobium TaxID=325217 RepID=UPI001FEED23A|nr:MULTISPECIES: hypothetical protein [unclassified Mesorhizobium]
MPRRPQQHAELDDDAVEEQIDDVVQPMPARRRLLGMQRRKLLERNEDEGDDQHRLEIDKVEHGRSRIG